jgi:hypothetical protein
MKAADAPKKPGAPVPVLSLSKDLDFETWEASNPDPHFVLLEAPQ